VVASGSELMVVIIFTVLEVSRSHPLCVMPAYIISCRLVTVLTLSRQDVLKISVEVLDLRVGRARRPCTHASGNEN
jgi:hypothetical protein